jgi:hypothetical protein
MTAEAITGTARTELHRMFVCPRGASSRVSPGSVTGGATKKAREKTSKMFWALTEVA